MNKYSHLNTSESTVVLQSCILEGFDAPTNQDSDMSGRIVVMKGSSDLAATDTIFRNSFSGLHGGGVLMDTGKLKLTRCTFSGLRSHYTGAALLFACISPIDTIIDSCTFDGNAADGGVVRIDNVQNGLTMKDCLFINTERIEWDASEIYLNNTVSLPSDNKTWISSSYSTSPSGEREEYSKGFVPSSDEALLSVTLTTITVSADGTDSTTCGLTPVLTCQTTSHALSRLPESPSTADQIVFTATTEVPEAGTLAIGSRNIAIGGKSANEKGHLKATGSDRSVVTITTAKVSISFLTLQHFTASSSFSSPLVAMSGAGSLVLNAVVFLPTDSSNSARQASFVKIDSGSLTTSTLQASAGFVKTSLLDLSPSTSCSLDGLTVSGIHGNSPTQSPVLTATVASASLTVSNSAFTSCVTSGNGGCLNVVVSGSGSLTVSSSSFDDCSASTGGALFVDITGMTASTNLDLSGASFGTISPNSASWGSDIFIKLTPGDENSKLASSQFSNGLITTATVFTSTELNRIQTSEGSLLYVLFPLTTNPLSVDGITGIDEARCGHSKLPCKTVQQGMTNLAGSVNVIELTSDVVLAAALAISKASTIQANIGTRQITLSRANVIPVNTDVTLSSLAFIQSAQLTSSAITLSSGSLTVTGCSFTGLSSSVSGTAISATISAGKTLSIADSAFVGCSTTKDGGALSLKLVGDASVSIGADFAGNTASDKGGSVFFDKSTSTLLAADSPITFISTTFGTAGASGSAANGKSVFIDGGSRQISTFLNVTDWDIQTKTELGVVGPVSSFTSKDLEGLPHPSGSTTKPFSFLHLFLGTSSRTPDSTIFVGQSGENQFGCGETKATPCRTVEWSVKEAAGSVVDIVVASNSLLSSPIILSNSDLQIAPDSDILCPFVVSLQNSSSASASMIRVERNSILTLRSLSMSFSLPASLGSVIVASSGIVSVESCVIQKVILSQPFLVSVQSSHTITNTSFLSSTFKTSAFVLSACQSLSIEDTRIANNSFDVSFLVISNNSIKQNTSLVELSILPKPTSEDTPTFHVSLSSFTSSPTTPTPQFVSVTSDSHIQKPAVLVKWTARQPLLLRRRVVCEDCFVMVSQSP
ncbi:hypothetical protein BLNAU_11824 [Blattamonas nauphoetae]|uniref:Uncharacterized protein n=1 Tax=Blattamonas nauphoetae TaxID=2049346 RepID=A0ABQ9XQR8_9EUKA|nr:hypothetical protein BLNAU_11824 [Blattamonas nauphoetae]